MTANVFLKPSESDRERNLRRVASLPIDDPRRIVNEVVDGNRKITQAELDAAVERLANEGVPGSLIKDFKDLASLGLVR